MNPFTFLLDLQRHAIEHTTEFMHKAAIAPERAARMADVEVGQTSNEVVYSESQYELRHYEPLTDQQHDVPILIVYALINRPYILDLQPDKSVVRRLLEDGFDVYLIDWNEPTRLDASLSLDDTSADTSTPAWRPFASEMDSMTSTSSGTAWAGR